MTVTMNQGTVNGLQQKNKLIIGGVINHLKPYHL